MAAKNQYRTSDYIQWDTMLTLIRRLYRDGDYCMSLLIGCGCFFGLRISDLRTLTWSMRKVYESAGTDAAMALMKLSELFNHSSPKITKIYLGIRQEELLQTYDMLTF